jgi:hypothetical protein
MGGTSAESKASPSDHSKRAISAAAGVPLYGDVVARKSATPLPYQRTDG